MPIITTVLVPDKPFRLSLMFVSKAGATRAKHLTVAHSRVGSWPHPQKLDKAVRACQEQTLYHITNICKLRP